MKYTTITLLGIFLLFSTLSACTPANSTQAVPPTAPGKEAIATAVMQTAQVQMTRHALETQIAAPTLTQTVFATVSLPTAVIPTPQPQQELAMPSPLPPECNQMELVGDVSIQPGTILMTGEQFTKTWRIENTGTCTWGGDYSLVFSSGDRMGGPEEINLNTTIYPGDFIDLSLKLQAPAETGDYTSRWMLRAPNAPSFGTGSESLEPLGIDIEVVRWTGRKTSRYPIEFTKNICATSWQTSAGIPLCLAPGHEFGGGSVYRTDTPILEGGHEDDEPTLITIPSEGEDGFISGYYPPIEILPGDYVSSWIGCLHDNPWCDVTFLLQYSVDGGPVQTLSSWQQIHDGEKEFFAVDLTPIAGQTVQIILTVENNGSSRDDRAFWLVPVLVRGG